MARFLWSAFHGMTAASELTLKSQRSKIKVTHAKIAQMPKSLLAITPPPVVRFIIYAYFNSMVIRL